MGKRLPVTTSLSRRTFLCGVGLIGAALLAACGESGAQTATVPPVATTAMIPSGGIPATVNTGGQAPALPTTAPAGSGGNATSPRAMAEAFLQAALAGNLAQAAQYYAPDKRPRSWQQVWGTMDPTDFDGNPFGIQQCRGVQYDIVERQSAAAGITFYDETVVFGRDCGISGSAHVSRPFGQVTIHTDNSAGRWYITEVGHD